MFTVETALNDKTTQSATTGECHPFGHHMNLLNMHQIYWRNQTEHWKASNRVFFTIILTVMYPSQCRCINGSSAEGFKVKGRQEGKGVKAIWKDNISQVSLMLLSCLCANLSVLRNCFGVKFRGDNPDTTLPQFEAAWMKLSKADLEVGVAPLLSDILTLA